MQSEMNASEFELRLPPDFDDGLWDSKGYFEGAELVVEGDEYRLVFYDPVRLMQDAQAEVESDGFFFEPNLIVIESIRPNLMREGVERIIRNGSLKKLVVSQASDFLAHLASRTRLTDVKDAAPRWRGFHVRLS